MKDACRTTGCCGDSCLLFHNEDLLSFTSTVWEMCLEFSLNLCAAAVRFDVVLKVYCTLRECDEAIERRQVMHDESA